MGERGVFCKCNIVLLVTPINHIHLEAARHLASERTPPGAEPECSLASSTTDLYPGHCKRIFAR
jgi:hypothetical protein